MHALDLRYHVTIMRSLIRLLLWLSITVLSFQGGAAMAVGQPVPTAHRVALMTIHHHQAVEQTGHGHCNKAGSKAVMSSHAKCASCASCCVGAVAPPALLPTLHAPPLVSSPHAMADTAMTSVVPSTLERPPRLDLV